MCIFKHCGPVVNKCLIRTIVLPKQWPFYFVYVSVPQTENDANIPNPKWRFSRAFVDNTFFCFCHETIGESPALPLVFFAVSVRFVRKVSSSRISLLFCLWFCPTDRKRRQYTSSTIAILLCSG